MRFEYILVTLVACCLLAGCQTEQRPAKTAEVPAATPQLTPAIPPPPEDAGTTYTVEYKDAVMYQGYAALVAPDEIRFTVRDDANNSIAPQLTAKVVVPKVAESGIAATPDAMNFYFTAKLPGPVEPPVTATLQLDIRDAEPQTIDVLLKSVESDKK